MISAFLRYLSAPLRKHLEGRPELHAVLANSGWLMADKVLRLLLGILVGTWVARYLGPEQFGELSYVLAFVAFVQTVSLLGLDGPTVRDLSKDPTQAGLILGTVFRLRLGAAFLGWLIACGLIWLLRPGDTTTFVLVSIVAAGMLLQTADIVDHWFQSKTKSRRTVAAKMVAYLFSNGLKVSLILAAAPLWTFAVAQVLESGVSALLLIRVYRTFRAESSWKWSPVVASGLLRQCWPFVFSGLAVMVYMRIDQIMLREMIGDKEVGIYSAALPFSQAWHFIPAAICTSLLPTFSRSYAESRELFYSQLQRLFTWLVWMAIPIAAVVALAANWLVITLLGNAYEASARVLAIHVVTNVFIFLGVAQLQWIFIESRASVSLLKTSVGAFVSVLANLILIPKYGATGAAISALIAQATSAVLSNLVLAPRIFAMQLKAIFPLATFRRSS